MANDQGNGGDGKKPQGKEMFSDELVAQIKHTILFGESPRLARESTRFKKGQSGNPAGRPKRLDIGLGSSRSANALVLKEAERLIGVREGEKVTQTPAIEAILRAQQASALRGNAYSQKHFIERYNWAERETRQQRMNEIEFWKAYIADERQAIANAEAKGETPPTPLPHPDDVLIDYETGVKFIGPVDEACMARLMEHLKIRDILIMHGVLDERNGDTEISDPLDRSGAMPYALLINGHVPERYRLSESKIAMLMRRHQVTPKRVLLKLVYRAWRELGMPAPRGWRFPSIRILKQLFDQVANLMATDRKRSAA